MPETAATGHRSVPHTADVRIEAWAPSREQCLAEAVVAMVETFVDTSAARPTSEAEFELPPGREEDLLAGLLDEVIFRMETEGRLPLRAEVVPDSGGGLRVRLATTGTGDVPLVGAVPKAISLHELRFGTGPTGWSCGVTLDV